MLIELAIKICFLFFRLRVRIKALQQTIDTQSVRITDLISSQVLASMNGRENYVLSFLLITCRPLQLHKLRVQCLSAMHEHNTLKGHFQRKDWKCGLMGNNCR